MARSARPQGHGCLRISALLMLLGVAGASLSGWRHGYIQWATCDAGFYDPAFPDVCLKCQDPLCVGVSIHVAIGGNLITAPGPTNGKWETMPTWLKFVAQDVNAFVDGTDTSRRLRLFRNRDPQTDANANELRIGYMLGLDKDARPPSATNPFDGLIECPVFDSTKEECTNYNFRQNYDFHIDKMDALNNVVYAHYSFEIEFDANGDYSVYFDGCCRPRTLKNKYELPFHLRAGIQLYAEGKGNGIARPYPKKSISISMPDVVFLREKGVSLDQCTEVPCVKIGGETRCFTRFAMQAMHPVEEYRDKIRVRLASPREAGYWRCDGDWSQLCKSGVQELDFFEPLEAQVEQRENGYFLIKFMVFRDGELRSEVSGTHSLSLMIDCFECVNGLTHSVPVEFHVEVKLAPSNADPPVVTFNPNPSTDVSGVAEVVPLTCPESALNIYCGRRRFELGENAAKYNKDFVRIGFKDVDDGTGPYCEGPNIIQKDLPQEIAGIHEVSLPTGITLGTLPTDINLGKLVLGPLVNNFDGLGYLNPLGVGYVDLQWRPACENPSHLGLKQLCFTARDSKPGGNDTWPFLYSPPSLLDISGFRESSNDNCPIPAGLRSSCIFVDVQKPKKNIPPQFVAPTSAKGSECSGDCCDCCDQPQCPCASLGRCCHIEYTTTGIYTFTVRAVDGPIIPNAMETFLPARDDHDSYEVYIRFTLPQDMVPMPEVMPMKYGCNGTSYDACISDPNRKSDTMTMLKWDLTEVGGCDGVNEDVTPCVPTPRPFKLCYRAEELAAPWVNPALWIRTYGEGPTRNSCDVCFIVAIADRPIFMDEDGESPVQGQVFEWPAGRELTFPLTAAAANDPGIVTISILSDPGAPLGAELGQPRKVLCSEVRSVCDFDHKHGFQRNFTYTPKAEHAGQTVEICFRASMADVKEDVDLASQISLPRCITVKVRKARLSWDGTQPCEIVIGEDKCAPQMHVDATVGCGLSYDLKVTAGLYDVRIEQLKLPKCSNCVGQGLAVAACSEFKGKGPCCGNGYCDGAEMHANCAEDCVKDDSSLTIVQTGSKNNNYVGLARYMLTPTRGMEGRRLLTCFGGTDVLMNTSVIHTDRMKTTAPSFCVVVDVERCTYCVPAGSSMAYISRQYVLNIDWLRLYNTNPSVQDPDGIFPYKKLVIGPKYIIHPGDTLLSIAASAKTTVKAILQNNPDILGKGDVEEDQEICLLLCSASPNRMK